MTGCASPHFMWQTVDADALDPPSTELLCNLVSAFLQWAARRCNQLHQTRADIILNAGENCECAMAKAASISRRHYGDAKSQPKFNMPCDVMIACSWVGRRLRVCTSGWYLPVTHLRCATKPHICSGDGVRAACINM